MKQKGKNRRLKSYKILEELKRLKKDSQYEKEKLQALLDISSGLHEAKTFEDIGKTIVINLTRFDIGKGFGVKLGVYDSVEDTYRIVFQTEDSAKIYKDMFIPTNKPCKLSEIKYYSKFAIERGKTLFIEDSHSAFSLSIDERQKDFEGHSMVFIPLFYRDELVGLLSCARTPSKSMDIEFVGFLESIAKYLSISVGELLIEKRQGEQQKLQTLLDISSGLYKAETFEDIGKTIGSNLDRFKIGEAIGTKLGVYDIHKDKYFVAFQTEGKTDPLKKVLSPINKPIRFKDIKYFSRITLENKKTLIIQDNHSEFALNIDIRQKDLPNHSMIFIPLLSAETLVGLLSFARSPENSMDPEFVDFLESVAKYVSIAVSKILNEKKRKKIEQEIIESEKRYRSLVDTSPDGIAFTDLSGRIIICNQKLIEMMGYEKIEDAIDKQIFESITPENSPNVKSDIDLLYQSGNIKNIEYELIKKDGSRYPVEINAAIVKDAKKNPYRIITIIRDITERKRAEEAIAYERYLFETLMNNSPDSIYFKDKESKFIRINKSLAEHFNLKDTKDAAGKTDFDFFTKERAEEPFKDERQILQTGQPIVNKDEIERWPDGRITWASTTKMALRDKNDEIIGTFGISRNITDRKLMEQALWNEKEELRITLRSIGEGVITTNKDGNIILLNEKAEEIIGWKNEDVINKPLTNIFNVINNKDDKISINPIKLILDDPSLESANVQSALIIKDGGKKIIDYITSSIKDKEGNFIGFIIVFRDITKQKELESQLALSQKMESIGQLAAGIAHEINTPMQYIGDNTRFLKDSFIEINEILKEFEEIEKTIKKDEDLNITKEYFKNILQKIDLDYLRQEILSAIEQSLSGIERVRNIVLAMKDFAHPGTKAKSFSDINHGIEVTVTISRNEWKYVADLELELRKDLPPVFCNLDEINQAILNMIINSSHSIKDVIENIPGAKGKIKITTEVEGDYAIIKITDTGKGIPREIIGRIFDPFFTTKEVGKGTGQGLAIVHDIIVNKHKGNILVDSEVGKGTCFILKIPINDIGNTNKNVK